MSDFSIRRFMLLRLSEEKQQVRQDIDMMNRTLNHIIKTEQTVRHCKKEALGQLLDDPELKKQYDELVLKIKELEDAGQPKPEERDTPPLGDNEQLPDGP